MQVIALIFAFASGCSNADAQADPYHITASEMAACTGDAQRLCADAYPDEEKLLTCMNANRTSLTAPCRKSFDAGLKRRQIAR